MRVLRFIRRQVRFLLVGTRDLSVSSDRLDTEVARLDAKVAMLSTQVAMLSTQVSEVSGDLVRLQQIALQLSDLDARVSTLHDHADNVVAHLRELTESGALASAAVNESGVRLMQVETAGDRHRKEIDAMRAALRSVVDDLGDRVTQLTVRLNEL